LKEVLRDAAAIEPAVRDLIAEDSRRRYETQRTVVELVLDPTSGGDGGAELTEAAASYFALVNSNSYQLLVGQLGWTVEQWEAWLVRILRRELLGPRRRDV
jgi:hypothetical protein